jgi:hypothetical protein
MSGRTGRHLQRGYRRSGLFRVSVVLFALGLLAGATAVLDALGSFHAKGTVAATHGAGASTVSHPRMSLPGRSAPRIRHRSPSPSPRAAGPPVQIVIPTIGVDASIVPLGLNPDGTLEVPTSFSQAGWWEHGAIPGNPGSAVIVGHVDSYRGPAVFFRLRDLRSKDVILVRRRDGSVAQFLVDRIGEFPKDAFPTMEVYGPSASAVLRLVTCGGPFDRGTRHYLDNIVVFAHESLAA